MLTDYCRAPRTRNYELEQRKHACLQEEVESHPLYNIVTVSDRSCCYNVRIAPLWIILSVAATTNCYEHIHNLHALKPFLWHTLLVVIEEAITVTCAPDSSGEDAR